MEKKQLKKMAENRGTRWRSILTPYESDIAALREGGSTYKEIAEILQARYGVKVSYNAVWNFVKVRDKRKPYRITPDGMPKIKKKPTVVPEKGILRGFFWKLSKRS